MDTKGIPRRVAFWSATYGYFVPIWYYGALFWPLRNVLVKNVLFYSCVDCFFEVRGAIVFCLLAIAPANAIIFGLLGFIVANLVSKIWAVARPSVR